MVSDTELAEYLGQVLREADLTTTTNALLRKQLEEHFGVDLSGKKAFIREQVNLYLQSLENNAEEDEEAGEQGEAVDAQNGNDSEEGGDAAEGDEDEEEEGDDDAEDDSGAGGSNGKSRKKKGSNKNDKEVKRKGGGFTKLCSLSPQLQQFAGEAELARTEVVKRIWAYIREHNLQNPSNKRIIICDAKLNAIFNVKSIDMFQMNKALSKHIWPLDSGAAAVSTTAKDKEKQGKRPKKSAEEEEEEEDDEDEPPKKEKRRKTGSGGFLAPLPISDALSRFVGTGVTEMSRSDVVKTMWDYIKQNKLQDPSDKRRIICDGKLKELFEVDSFNGFTVAKLLGPHFIKPEK